MHSQKTNAQKNNYFSDVLSMLIPDNLINIFIYFNRVTFPKVMGTSTSPKTAKDYEENETSLLLLAMNSLQNERYKGASVAEVLRWKEKTDFGPMSKLTGVYGKAEVKQL